MMTNLHNPMMPGRQTVHSEFPLSAPSANPVFYRTYSRRLPDGSRETWQDAVDRNLAALVEIGKFSPSEADLVRRMQLEQKALPSGRWLWVGGTDWIKNPKNFSGAYNCTSTDLVDWEAFALMMDLAMMGCGTGAVIQPWHISQLPIIKNEIIIDRVTEIGTLSPSDRKESTAILQQDGATTLRVGDSRRGWVDAYLEVLKLSSTLDWSGPIHLEVDLSNVRPSGEALKGFGGTANPVKLSTFWGRIASILNRAKGRKLTSVECCLLIDEAAVVVVAGNVRRSAGMRQFHERDTEAGIAKDNLWQKDDDGNWRIDPERDALRMANHTRVFHRKPTRDEVLDSVRRQFISGEGAIQYAPEAVARANRDLLATPDLKLAFLSEYCAKNGGPLGAAVFLDKLTNHTMLRDEVEHRVSRYGLNPCFAAGTMVLTRDGHYPIESLVGKTVEIYDGERWVAVDSFRVTGTNQPVYNLALSNGSVIQSTETHVFILNDGSRVQLKDLKPGMKLLPIFKSLEYADQVSLDEYTSQMLNYIHIIFLRYHGLSEQDVKYVAALAKKVGIKADRAAMILRSALVQLDNKAHADLPDNHNAITRLGDIIRHGIHNSIIEIPLGQLILQLADAFDLVLSKQDQLIVLKSIFGIEFVPDMLTMLSVPFGEILDLFTNIRRSDSDVVAVKSVEFSHVADKVYCCTVPDSHSFALSAGIVVGNCGEIIGDNLHCNLSEVHLNQLRPDNHTEQQQAFYAAAISAAALLHHRFEVPRFRRSREWDPIIGISFTGLFDFFVEAFGVEWLKWFVAGRPATEQGNTFRTAEKSYLVSWRESVAEAVYSYCARHNLRMPNRYTTVQPAGTKSLLTGASPGWHPPKSQRFIRRITFRKGDPVAMACLDYGYSIVPSQSDKDEDGRLLNDPFDSRCTEWLVEIPTEVTWANMPGADEVDLSHISALAQFDFYMQVQRYYTTHNTSATIEYREHEIEPLADAIHGAIQNDDGYISAALLARFDANETFPHLPFEPIDRATYDHLQAAVVARRRSDDFGASMRRHDGGELVEAGPAGCDSDKCLLPLGQPAGQEAVL